MGREVQQQVSLTVEQLVAVNPYNPDILNDLEDFVNEQVSSKTYNLEANLCLLRLYQFEPEKMKTQFVANILRKALMAMPAPDFSLCLFLIPERVQMEDQFKTMIVLSHYLETARFSQFWEEATKNRHVLETVPDHNAEIEWTDAGFEQAIQNFIVHVLSLTYQKVSRRVLSEAINLDGPSLDKFLEHQVSNNGWIVDQSQSTGELIILPCNQFNHPELKRNSAETVPLGHLTRIFSILS